MSLVFSLRNLVDLKSSFLNEGSKRKTLGHSDEQFTLFSIRETLFLPNFHGGLFQFPRLTSASTFVNLA